MDSTGPRNPLTTGERDVGLTAIPPLWSRRLDAVAGKLQYRHAAGDVAWTPIEVLSFEAQWAKRRELAAQARGAQAMQPPPPPTPQPAPP
eukprot:13660926-Alexandrium_andersonii.AAC.1